MARKGKARQEADDAAWLRAQQIDIETQAVAPAPQPATPEEVLAGVPESCHGCGKTQTLDSGWTLLHCDESAGAIQCGACGIVGFIQAKVWQQLKDRLRNHFAMRAVALNPPKIKRARRERGAG